MSYDVRTTPQSEKDLRDIYEYIAFNLQALFGRTLEKQKIDLFIRRLGGFQLIIVFRRF